jgi:hypothetical protein
MFKTMSASCGCWLKRAICKNAYSAVCRCECGYKIAVICDFFGLEFS